MGRIKIKLNGQVARNRRAITLSQPNTKYQIPNTSRRIVSPMGINKHAQFFTIDALIALTVIILTIMVVVPVLKQPRADSSVSADILQSLSTLKIGEMDSSYLATLDIQDPDKLVIDQIGEFYITDISIARQLSAEVLSSISPTENIGIWYGAELLASKNITPMETAENVFTERQTISGIGGTGGGVTGFSARAFLSSSARTDYVYFGGYVGEGNISALVEYQGNITSAEIELVINNDFEVYVNETKDSGTFTASANEYTPKSYTLDTSNFESGTNILELRGENLHITGGFIKITYDSEVTYEQPKRYKFPGINGIINLYDGFYVPGNLTGLSISLHFNNTVNTFLTIGDTQVFNATSDGTTIEINNVTLAALLNYKDLSKKTIPLRFGMEDVDYVTNNSKDIDVVSSTDISGSMQPGCRGTSPWYCCWFNNCNTEAGCNSCGGTLENPIQDAKDANKLFIDMILNDTENRVGLNAYSSSVLSSNTHELSNDDNSLKAEVDSWNADGATCICCGVNDAVGELLANSGSEKFQSIVIMSDGDANRQCAEQGTGNAEQDAIQSACDAYNDHGIKVYTIGFGLENVQVLTEMASCADGSFYNAVDDIADIYEKIAEEIIETAFFEQTIEVSNTDFISHLYPDSYIEFEYTEETPYVGLLATIEETFSTEAGTNFTIPKNSTPIEANVISYSGPKWTSLLDINNNNVYNLSSYETDFLKLGDPYSVNIPASLIQNTNNLSLEIGLSPSNTTAGTINNKIIYTISKDLASYTSVSDKAEGCNWTIQFEEHSMNLSVPSDYSGSATCNYGNASTGIKHCDGKENCEGSNDAVQIAVYNIFKLLDFDSDGKLDVELSEDTMQITTSNLEGVPFLYTTEVKVSKWY